MMDLKFVTMRGVLDIGSSINHKVTKLHIICFCVSVRAGVFSEDIQVIRQYMNIFRKSVSKNSCMVMTHCESQDQESRNTLNRED